MNYLKIQQDVLKALCKGEKVEYFPTDNNGVFLTLRGSTHGWIVPEDQLHLDLAGAQLLTPLDMSAQGAPLTGTDFYRKGGCARQYNRPDGEVVYIDNGLLKYFDSPVLYQKGVPFGPVVVVEHPIDGRPEVVGLVCPVRVKETSDDREDWEG